MRMMDLSANIKNLEDYIVKSETFLYRDVIDLKIRQCLTETDRLLLSAKQRKTVEKLKRLRAFLLGFGDVLETLKDNEVPTVGMKYLLVIKSFAKEFTKNQKTCQEQSLDELFQKEIRMWEGIKDIIFSASEKLPITFLIDELNEHRARITDISLRMKSEINLNVTNPMAYVFLYEDYKRTIENFIKEMIETEDISNKFAFANEIGILINEWYKNYKAYPEWTPEMVAEAQESLEAREKPVPIQKTKQKKPPSDRTMWKILKIISRCRNIEESKSMNINKFNVSKESGLSYTTVNTAINFAIDKGWINSQLIGKTEYFFLSPTGVAQLRHLEKVMS